MWRVLHRNENYCVNELGEVLSLRKNKLLSPMFPSTMEVERELGIAHTNISYAIKHNSFARGYKWKYDKNL